MKVSTIFTGFDRFLPFFLKGAISTTYYFSFSFLYSVFLILSAISIYGQRTSNLPYLFSFFVTSLWLFSFIYYASLSFKKPRQYMEKTVGQDFINKYSLKGHYSCLFPFLLTLAFVIPILLEDYTFEERMVTYNQIMEPLYECYVAAFSKSGGIIGDYANTGVIEKSARSPAMDRIYSEMLKYPKPLNGITIELVRRSGF